MNVGKATMAKGKNLHSVVVKPEFFPIKALFLTTAGLNDPNFCFAGLHVFGFASAATEMNTQSWWPGEKVKLSSSFTSVPFSIRTDKHLIYL